MVWEAVSSDDTNATLGHDLGAVKFNTLVDVKIFQEHVLLRTSDVFPVG